MVARWQLAVDCADPQRLVPFWAEALDYELQAPPDGFAGWNAYWRSVGVPEHELDDGSDTGDRLVDPTGAGPNLWFQRVPEGKVIKNRLHVDLKVTAGRSVPLETRTRQVEAEAARLEGLGATRLTVLSQEGLDHYAIVLQDPEGNEFCVG